jgi:hypothetical protein
MADTEQVGAVSNVEIATALGRIEANVSNLAELTNENVAQMKEFDHRLRAVETAVAQKPDDARIRVLENKVDVLDAKQPVRVPWWTIASGIAAIAAVVSTIFILFNYNITTG